MNLKQVREWYGGQFPNQKDMDPLIRSLLDLLNEMPGCATICSCAGAGPVGNTKKKHPKKDFPYIYMVCRNVHSMATILLAYHKCNGFDISYHTPESKMKRIGMGFEIDAGEPAMSFHFRNYKQLKKFEVTLKEFVTAFVGGEEIKVRKHKMRVM